MIPALLATAFVLGSQQAAPQVDTLVISADEAFGLALGAAPSLQASRSRTGAADALVRQAGAWSNPVLSVTAENLGATQPTTGIQGAKGVEGQAVLSGLLPIGGDRGALRSGAEARLLEARSLEAGAEADVRTAVVQAVARLAQMARLNLGTLQTLDLHAGWRRSPTNHICLAISPRIRHDTLWAVCGNGAG